MKIEIEYKGGKIHVTLNREGKATHFEAAASQNKATVIFADIMKHAVVSAIFKDITTE